MKLSYKLVIAAFFISIFGGLIWSANHYYSKYQIEKLRADKAVGEAEYQGKVIAEQAFNFSRFNQVAEYTGSLNSLLSDSGEKTVIKYREILHREKNCDFPVPADIANGVLEYANSLRSGAIHSDPGHPYSADNDSFTTGALTYCQAVLWIEPLLTAIDRANNQLAGIRQIERERQQYHRSPSP